MDIMDFLEFGAMAVLTIGWLLQAPWKPKNLLKRLGAKLNLTGRGPPTPFGPAVTGKYRGVNAQLEICTADNGRKGKGVRVGLQVRCPMPRGLRLSREALGAGDYEGLPDLEIGVPGVDRALLIQAEDEEGARSLLAAPEAREALMRFFGRYPGGRIEGDWVIYEKSKLPGYADDLRELLDDGMVVVNAIEGRWVAPQHTLTSDGRGFAIGRSLEGRGLAAGRTSEGPDLAAGRSPEEIKRRGARRAEYRQMVRRARWRRAGSLLGGVAVMSSGFFIYVSGRIVGRQEAVIWGGLVLGALITVFAFRCPACGKRVKTWNQLIPDSCEDCGVALR